MNESQIPPYLQNHLVDGAFDNNSFNSYDFQDFTNIVSNSTPSKPFLDKVAKGSVSSFEQELADTRNENARLRQQLSARMRETLESWESHPVPDSGQVNGSFSHPHPNKITKVTGSTEHEPAMPSIGDVIDPKAIFTPPNGRLYPTQDNSTTTRNIGANPGATATQGANSSNSAMFVQPESRAKRHFSRPFRGQGKLSQGQSAPNQPLNALQVSKPANLGNEQRIDKLLVELTTIRDQLQELERRYSDMDARLASKATNELEGDRDERFCEYFDWVFEFIVEMVQVLKQQDVQIPAKLMNVYSSITNI